MIFDTHAHYDDEAFNEDREDILLSMKENGVGTIVNVGSSLESTRNTLTLIKKYPFVYGAAGVHPNEVGELDENSFTWLKKAALEDKILAIGEIGLEYHYEEPERSIQKVWFERQLDLAKEIKKPVIIHSRDAAEDTYKIMVNKNAGEIGGVIHCYSYSPQMALDYVKMGFYIGIGGVVTFKNGRKMKEVVDAVPMDRIVLETDSPYLAPEPFRGKRNNSTLIHYIANEIAGIKNISKEEVIENTKENAKKMFNLKGDEPWLI